MEERAGTPALLEARWTASSVAAVAAWFASVPGMRWIMGPCNDAAAELSLEFPTALLSAIFVWRAFTGPPRPIWKSSLIGIPYGIGNAYLALFSSIALHLPCSISPIEFGDLLYLVAAGTIYGVPMGAGEGIAYGIALGVLVHLVHPGEGGAPRSQRWAFMRSGLWLCTIALGLIAFARDASAVPLALGVVLALVGVARGSKDGPSGWSSAR